MAKIFGSKVHQNFAPPKPGLFRMLTGLARDFHQLDNAHAKRTKIE